MCVCAVKVIFTAETKILRLQRYSRFGICVHFFLQLNNYFTTAKITFTCILPNCTSQRTWLLAARQPISINTGSRPQKNYEKNNKPSPFKTRCLTVREMTINKSNFIFCNTYSLPFCLFQTPYDYEPATGRTLAEDSETYDVLNPEVPDSPLGKFPTDPLIQEVDKRSRETPKKILETSTEV